MLLTTLKVLHVLAIVVWVGGMAFAHFFLRPSLAVLAPPQRLALMTAVLARFLNAMVVAVGLALASGVGMMVLVWQQVQASGGQMLVPSSWTAMALLGLLMALIFGHIRAVLYPRLARALAADQLPQAALALGVLRQWVLVNLVLGTLVTVWAVAGGA